MPDLPADGVDEGTGEEPRDEETIPDVPVDVPAEDDGAPLEGDQDPDGGAVTDDSNDESATTTEDQTESGLIGDAEVIEDVTQGLFVPLAFLPGFALLRRKQ